MAVLYRNVPYHLSHNAISPSPLTYVICTALYLGLQISQGHAALLLIPISLFSITQHAQISSVTSDLRLICIWAATFFAKSQNNLFFFFFFSKPQRPARFCSQKLLSLNNPKTPARKQLISCPASLQLRHYHVPHHTCSKVRQLALCGLWWDPLDRWCRTREMNAEINHCPSKQWHRCPELGVDVTQQSDVSIVKKQSRNSNSVASR